VQVVAEVVEVIQDLAMSMQRMVALVVEVVVQLVKVQEQEILHL